MKSVHYCSYSEAQSNCLERDSQRQKRGGMGQISAANKWQTEEDPRTDKYVHPCALTELSGLGHWYQWVRYQVTGYEKKYANSRATDLRRTIILARLIHSGVLRGDMSISLYGACQLVYMYYSACPWQVGNGTCFNNDRDVSIDNLIGRSAQIMGSLVGCYFGLLDSGVAVDMKLQVANQKHEKWGWFRKRWLLCIICEYI